jgi:hypothetical protein
MGGAAHQVAVEGEEWWRVSLQGKRKKSTRAGPDSIGWRRSPAWAERLAPRPARMTKVLQLANDGVEPRLDSTDTDTGSNSTLSSESSALDAACGGRCVLCGDRFE